MGDGHEFPCINTDSFEFREEEAPRRCRKSLVATVVNYSISLAVGFAGTVETHANNGGVTPTLLLKAYRGAWYMSISLGVLGFLVYLS